MAERHYGLTDSGGGTLFENACVCLDRHHTSPTQFEIVDRKVQIRTTVEWDAPSCRIKAAYANNIDATEAGEYACVIAAVELAKHLYAVRRAETATGADYYLNPINQQMEDLEGCLRLEFRRQILLQGQLLIEDQKKKSNRSKGAIATFLP